MIVEGDSAKLFHLDVLGKIIWAEVVEETQSERASADFVGEGSADGVVYLEGFDCVVVVDGWVRQNAS